jgi:hypothetical protein
MTVLKLLRLAKISILEQQVTRISVNPNKLVLRSINRNGDFMNYSTKIESPKKLRGN